MKNKLIYLFLLVFAFACKNQPVNNEEKENLPQTKEMEVSLTEEQIKVIALETGVFDRKNIGLSFKATGIVDIPPASRALVNAPMEGFVRQFNLNPGEKISQGQVLVILEDPSYIKLQQDYLVIKNELKYLEAEKERQFELSKENINARKALERVEADYGINLAKKASLEAQLKMINISPANVSPSNLSSRIAITSPISGFLKKVEINLGQHVQPGQSMFEVVNTEHKHIELNIFEQDIHQVSKNQKVIFSSPNIPGREFKGHVFLIGQSFEPDTKAVLVHVHMDEETSEDLFLEGMFVEARVLLESRETEALPDEAIIREGEQSFIFVEKEKKGGDIIFSKIPVKILGESGDFTAIKIMKTLPKNPKIVRKGAFYLQAQMNISKDDES